MSMLEMQLVKIINEGLSKGTIKIGEFERIPANRPNGFKSNAETRFGHFCDYHGIDYEYEPHTFIRSFETVDAIPVCYAIGRFQYTPDFFIPSLNLYVEIKAQDHYLSKSLRLKYYAFGSQIMARDGIKFAVINYGYSDVTTKLELTNFGHPDENEAELSILDLLLQS